MFNTTRTPVLANSSIVLQYHTRKNRKNKFRKYLMNIKEIGKIQNGYHRNAGI